MSDTIINTASPRIDGEVCIDTKRIFDSCVSRDCAEELRVTFFGGSQDLIDNANNIKTRDCDLVSCSIDVEEIPFNRGYYSVDIDFYFRLRFDTFDSPFSNPRTAIGYTKFNKRCILYGSDGDVKIFTSNVNTNEPDAPEAPQYTNPIAKVQAVDPVVLDTDVIEIHHCHHPLLTSFPSSVIGANEATNLRPGGRKAVLVTLGIFSIIQMQRDVQLLIPAINYCIPEKECACDTQDPCSVFQGIEFPTEEFFPPDRNEIDNI